MELENRDLDEEMIGQPLWWRLLVTYLPWLHPFDQWRGHRHNFIVEDSSDTTRGLEESQTRHGNEDHDIERGDNININNESASSEEENA